MTTNSLESGAPARILRHRRRQNLERHLASETRIFRPVDLAHPAFADGADDFVWSEARSCLEGHRGDYINGGASSRAEGKGQRAEERR